MKTHGHYKGGFYAAYRDGPKKAPKKKFNEIVSGNARKITISEIMNVLRDWRYSEFEHEAACLHGLRVAFCLKGYGWGGRIMKRGHS